VADNRFEFFGREFKRAMEEHGQLLNEELKRVSEQMRWAMEPMRAEMERVGAELQRVMQGFHEERGSPADWHEISVTADRVDKPSKKTKAKTKKKGRRGRRRGDEAASGKARP
jgi:hypothetical protein